MEIDVKTVEDILVGDVCRLDFEGRESVIALVYKKTRDNMNDIYVYLLQLDGRNKHTRSDIGGYADDYFIFSFDHCTTPGKTSEVINFAEVKERMRRDRFDIFDKITVLRSPARVYRSYRDHCMKACPGRGVCCTGCKILDCMAPTEVKGLEFNVEHQGRHEFYDVYDTQGNIRNVEMAGPYGRGTIYNSNPGKTVYTKPVWFGMGKGAEYGIAKNVVDFTKDTHDPPAIPAVEKWACENCIFKDCGDCQIKR
jgi:hypothetical protein